MDRVPHPPPPHACPADELCRWIAYERDAAWAAKLAVLRLEDPEHIGYVGTCIRDHERHAEELTQLVRAIDREQEVPTEPVFVSRDALVVGSLDGGPMVLDALAELEKVRIARYEERRRDVSVLDALLERHLEAARARLVSLQSRRATRRVSRGVAA